MGFVLLADEVLAAPAASMSVSVDTAYRMFRVTVYGINTTRQNMQLRLNGDTGANYAKQTVSASSTSVQGERTTGATGIFPYPEASYAIGLDEPFLFTFEISKPLTSTPARIVSSGSWMDEPGGTPPAVVHYASTVAEWNNTADLISSISLTIGINFAIGTRIVIEGAE